MKQSIDINDILKRVLYARLPIAKIEGVWQGIHLKSRRTIHVSVSINILQGVSSYQWEELIVEFYQFNEHRLRLYR